MSIILASLLRNIHEAAQLETEPVSRGMRCISLPSLPPFVHRQFRCIYLYHGGSHSKKDLALKSTQGSSLVTSSEHIF